MPSCLPQSKHVKLTQACFPKSKTATAKPNSSELQYLAYYASSRPKKLIKVGAYLRAKVVKDAYWNRQGDVIVNLAVCTALIEKCHNNLNLFANDVLHILQTALSVKDITIVEHVQLCWSIFCKHHDGVALGTDITYTRTFLDVLNTLSDIAQGKQNLNEVPSARYIGMEGMKSATMSPALRITRNGPQIHVIVLAILENLKNTKVEALYNMKQQLDRSKIEESRGRQSSFLSHGVVEPIGLLGHAAQLQELDVSSSESIIILSLDCLRQLFDCNDASQLVETTSEMLKHTNISGASNYTWASSIMHIAAEWTPINLRFHLLSACLSGFLQTTSSHWPSASQENFLHIVHDLLASKIILIGLSTVDVLDHLLAVASDALQKVESDEKESLQLLLLGNNIDSTESMKAKFLYHIERTILAINTHLYYNDQIRDIFKVLAEKVRFTVTLESAESNLLFTLFLLDAATRLIRMTMARREEADPRFVLPMSIFDNVIGTLHNYAEPVRTKFLHLLSQYFQYRMNLVSPCEEAQSRQRSLEHFRLAIYHYILLYSNRTKDMHNLITSLQDFWLTLSEIESESFLPVLYHAVQNPSPARGQQSRAEDIADLLYQILQRCRPSTNFDLLKQTISASHALPSISTLLTRRNDNTTASSDVVDAYVSTWIPDEDLAYPSRAVSIRHTGRSHMNASIVASREQLLMPATPVSVHNKAVTRITYLKQHLLNPKSGPSTSEITPSGLDLTSIFDGIELQEVHAPHVEALHTTSSSEAAGIIEDNNQTSMMSAARQTARPVQLLGRAVS